MREIGFCLGLLSCTCALANPTGTPGPDDLYLSAHMTRKKGNKMATAGDHAGAATEYGTAKKIYERIQRDFPAWERQLVDYRLTQLASKSTVSGPAKLGWLAGKWKAFSENPPWKIISLVLLGLVLLLNGLLIWIVRRRKRRVPPSP